MMGNKKIRAGIIGCGRRGIVHADSISKIQEAELLAVNDSDSDRARDLAKTHGAEVYNDAEKIINDPEIDTVVIATPTLFHARAIIDAAKLGKNIFCEKPLCRTIEEAVKIESAVKSSGVQFGMSFQRRYSWPEKRIKDLLPLLGEPKAARITNVNARYKRKKEEWTGNFETSGGYTLDTMVHLFDLMRWYLGEVKTVNAQGLLLSPELPEPMDYTFANLEFENGAFASAEGGWIRRGVNIDNYLYLVGTEGTIYCDDAGKIKVFSRDKDFEEEGDNVESPNILLMRNFVRGILEKKMFSPSFTDAMASFRIAAAAIESIRRKEPVHPGNQPKNI